MALKLLEKLTATPGIAGREDRVRQVIREEATGLFDSLHEDALGSLIGVKRPSGPARKTGGKGGKQGTKGKKPGSAGEKPPIKVMLAAHMDQIGFMVRHVDTKGFLRLNPVGGFDPRNLFARVVTVCTESGDIPGVMNPGGRPVHIASDSDKKKIPQVHEFIVDLGLPPEEVSRRVRIGDMVVLKADFLRVGDMIVSQCLDNRIACWVAIEAIRRLKRHTCEIHCVFTVQEEVGLRGAGPAAFGIAPEIGIAIDTTLCVDTPGVPEEERVTAFGGGAALTCMDSSYVSDQRVFDHFETVARKKKIPYQRSVLPRGGTDSGTIQRSTTGVRVMTLSCPTRYIHTVTEAVHKGDLYACRNLLAAALETLA